MWIILDWTGKRLFPDKEFESFDEGWGFVREQIPDEEAWQDIYVERKPAEETEEQTPELEPVGSMGGMLGPTMQRVVARQFLVDELVARLGKLGVDWSDITDTDSADPLSVEPPTNAEIRKVQEYLAAHEPK